MKKDRLSWVLIGLLVAAIGFIAWVYANQAYGLEVRP